MAAFSVASFRPSVRPSTWQLEIRANPKYFLPLSVRYSVIADSRRSGRSSRAFFLARANCNYTDYKLRCS